jgi:hypothetical protein
MAPEIIAGELYGLSVDVFSVVAVAFSILLG